MGRHGGNSDDQEQQLQQKADDFDAQFAESAARAEEKRDSGQYPYDLDSKVKR